MLLSSLSSAALVRSAHFCLHLCFAGKTQSTSESGWSRWPLRTACCEGTRERCQGLADGRCFLHAGVKDGSAPLLRLRWCTRCSAYYFACGDSVRLVAGAPNTWRGRITLPAPCCERLTSSQDFGMQPPLSRPVPPFSP
eukprot:2914177-Pleurochrysis_carterae.AAC.2